MTLSMSETIQETPSRDLICLLTGTILLSCEQMHGGLISMFGLLIQTAAIPELFLSR